LATNERIAVIGLGYVGLPLAVALSRHFPVTGFDTDQGRVSELNSGHDRTGEISTDRLGASTLKVIGDEAALDNNEVFIVTVPTPVDSENQPDLSAVEAASQCVGRHLKPGAVVVFESTVYPGVTEDICGPIIEQVSGLTCGKDFHLGYSPERINPGDTEHGIESITKVVAGQSLEVTKRIAAVYETITGGNVYCAIDIRTAEAAKVIENAQRDINIAFVNEIAMICHRLNISTKDVLAAANTKWNFLDFQPGLVGGHCIGVDPYYLAFKAQELGHDPEILLAGRRLNDSMGEFVATEILNAMDAKGRVLVLGLTFKEDIPDLRNSKVIDVIRGLEARGCDVDTHDPHANRDEARAIYGVDLLPDLSGASGYDAIVVAVAHAEYANFDADKIEKMLAPAGVVADVKGLWQEIKLPDAVKRWTL
jgi:UDP-N-acetyl-D-galactosamine dehydrogenase